MWIVVKLVGGLLVSFGIIKLLMKLFFPQVVNFFMKRTHSFLPAHKRKLFDEAVSNVETKASEKLNVLEIGVGTGENFKYYPPNARLTILDKTDVFRSFYEQSIKDHNRPDLTISDLVVNHAENMKDIPSNSFDLVVHTFFICSIDDPRKVLTEIYRVLKPGGVLIFIEHSKADSRDKQRLLVQKIVEPCLGDCNFRDIRKIIDQGVYDQVVFKSDYYISSLFLYFINPVVSGYAKKRV